MIANYLAVLAIVAPIVVVILGAAFVLKGDLSALKQQLADHIKVSERADVEASGQIAALRTEVGGVKQVQAADGQRIASLERKVHG